MTLIPDEFEIEQLLRKERIAISSLLVLIVTFMVFDIIDDWLEGNSIYHLIPEALIGTLGMGSAMYLFFKLSKNRNSELKQARNEMVEAKKAASEWKSKAGNLREGLSNAINQQLTKWGLTDAEQEIAYLLLKGFSLQEIADLRQTSERTVRQQASVVYKKSGLSGRVQLSAFFLEDLLVAS